MKFLGSTKIRERGQITLPKEARELLDAKRSEHVLFYLNNKNEIIVKKP